MPRIPSKGLQRTRHVMRTEPTAAARTSNRMAQLAKPMAKPSGRVAPKPVQKPGLRMPSNQRPLGRKPTIRRRGPGGK